MPTQKWMDRAKGTFARNATKRQTERHRKKESERPERPRRFRLPVAGDRDRVSVCVCERERTQDSIDRFLTILVCFHKNKSCMNVVHLKVDLTLCDMIHTYATCLIHMRYASFIYDMTHLYVFVCDMTHAYVTRPILCDMVQQRYGS